MALQTKTISENGSKGRHNFTLTITEDSTNVATNTSSVSWSFSLSPVKTSWSWSSSAGRVQYKVVVNGATYSGAIASYDGYATVTIASGEGAIQHNADGSKAISFSFTVTDSKATTWTYGPGDASASGSMTLTNIPRGATITSAPDFNDEQNPTITYSNPAGSAATMLDACISFTGERDDIPYRAIPKSGNTYTFNLTDAERETLRNGTAGSNSRTVIFYVRSTVGGAGYFSTLYKTLTIVNAAPVLDPVVVDMNEDVTSLTGGDPLVRYLSNVYFETGASGQKGATITSQSVTCGGVTLPFASGTINGVLSGDFIFIATDSRGNTTTQTVRLPFIEYVGLSCSIGNSKPDTDGDFTLTASGTCYNGDVGSAGSNDLYVLYRYKESGGEFNDWGEMAIIKGANQYTATVNFTGLDYRKTYIFQCRAGDLLTTATTDEVAIKSLPVFDWSGADFNFNVPVSAPALNLGGVPLDYIVEQGEKNGWSYRKWNGGILECWKNLVYKTAINNQWGNLYLSPTATDRQSYPYPFVKKPIEQVTVQANHPAWVVSASNGLGVNGTYASGCYHLISPGTYASVEHYLSYYVIGYWK